MILELRWQCPSGTESAAQLFAVDRQPVAAWQKFYLSTRANLAASYTVWNPELDPKHFQHCFRADSIKPRHLESLVRDLKLANDRTPRLHPQVEAACTSLTKVRASVTAVHKS
jgi:hypothetical protein